MTFFDFARKLFTESLSWKMCQGAYFFLALIIPAAHALKTFRLAINNFDNIETNSVIYKSDQNYSNYF